MQQYFIEYSRWMNEPFYWFCVILHVRFISMCIHEIGHAVVARMACAKVTGVYFGSPRFYRVGIVQDIEVWIGLPIRGKCYYEWPFMDRTIPIRSAFVCAGGWAFDTLALIMLTVTLSEDTLETGIGYIANIYLWGKVLIGLSPLTGDGRSLISDIRNVLWNSLK